MIAPLLASLLLTTPADTASAPFVRLLRDTVRAGRTNEWSLPIHVGNPGGQGLYLDSLIVRVEDAEAVRRGRPPVSVTRPNGVLRALSAVSAGETGKLVYVAPATIERGRIAITIHAHRGAAERHVLACSVAVDAGAWSREFPSTVARVGGRDVEFVRAGARREPEGAPGILLLPGVGSDARSLLPQVLDLTGRGYHVVALSLPGRGLTAGPDDLAGPGALALASAALDTLLAMTGVDRSRIGVVGLGDGADVALLLAAQQPSLQAVFAAGGSYDFWRAFREAGAPRQRLVLERAGRDSSAWRARSPLHAAARIRSRVVLAHAEADTAAAAVAGALARAGVTVQSRLIPGDPAHVAHETLEACEGDFASYFGR